VGHRARRAGQRRNTGSNPVGVHHIELAKVLGVSIEELNKEDKL